MIATRATFCQLQVPSKNNIRGHVFDPGRHFFGPQDRRAAHDFALARGAGRRAPQLISGHRRWRRRDRPAECGRRLPAEEDTDACHEGDALLERGGGDEDEWEEWLDWEKCE